jgi:hypothetical protein
VTAGAGRGARRRWPAALGAGLGVTAALAAGVLVWGRVADTPESAMVLTGGWFLHHPAAGSQVARLRGTSGNQNYPLAAGRRLPLPVTVLIWCRTFDTPVAAATIR